MKIWLDDMREAPDESWVHVRNEREFFDLLECAGENEEIEVISFDHDLGEGEPTGYDILKKFIFLCIEDTSFRLWPRRIESQSANPPGRANILGLAESFKERYVSLMHNNL